MKAGMLSGLSTAALPCELQRSRWHARQTQVGSLSLPEYICENFSLLAARGGVFILSVCLMTQNKTQHHEKLESLTKCKAPNKL